MPEEDGTGRTAVSCCHAGRRGPRALRRGRQAGRRKGADLRPCQRIRLSGVHRHVVEPGKRRADLRHPGGSALRSLCTGSGFPASKPGCSRDRRERSRAGGYNAGGRPGENPRPHPRAFGWRPVFLQLRHHRQRPGHRRSEYLHPSPDGHGKKPAGPLNGHGPASAGLLRAGGGPE